MGRLPQYQMVKSMAEGFAQVEGADGARPALINIEEAWQLGYVLEPLDNYWVAAFLPQPPTTCRANVISRLRANDKPVSPHKPRGVPMKSCHRKDARP